MIFIYLCEDTDRVNTTFRTGHRATQMVVAGVLVPAWRGHHVGDLWTVSIVSVFR